MLSIIILVLMSAAAPASGPTPEGLDDQLWATYLAPGAQVPAQAQVLLIEGVPLVKAAEGYPVAFAALGSVLDYSFPPGIISFTYAIPPIGPGAAAHVSRLLGPAPTQKEVDQVATSLSRGELRQVLEPLMEPYMKAVAQAEQLRRKNRGALLSMGQIRMAFLHVASDSSVGDGDSLEKALAGLAGLHHIRLVGRESAQPAFAEVMDDVRTKGPSLMVYKSGDVYVVVGAIEDGDKRYLVFGDPRGVSQRIRTGKENVHPRDLTSKDPAVQTFAEGQMKMKFYLDYKLTRSQERPAGVLLRPFDPVAYRRWIAYHQYELDLGAVPGLEDRLRGLAQRIKEVPDGQ